MIERLHIRNLVLVQESILSFGPQLNIITGETGSGKSAVLAALRLILGERADVSLVGNYGDIAIVEAEVVLPKKRYHLRREVHKAGKSRCFIDDELVSLTELKAHFHDVLEMVDQGAAFKLLEAEEQRSLLDAFGKIDLNDYRQALQIAQEKESALTNKRLVAKEIREQEERLKEQLSLLDEVDWKSEEEEEKLTNAHNALTKQQKNCETLSELATFISEGSILATLKRFQNKLEEGALSGFLQNARANLEEASLYVDSYLARSEYSAEQLEKIEKRMSDIELIKRRFAKTQKEAEMVRQTIREKLSSLDSIDEEIKALEEEISAGEKHLSHMEEELTKKRKKEALALQKEILSQLSDLNVANARLEIQIHPKERSPSGKDRVEFQFSANPGSPLLPLESVASGGELSRILLSIKIALKEKKCLILDEIDSNVGGHSATLLGLKLKDLARYCQIICVTHFVQVAKCASHHFLVTKQIQINKAVTQLQLLDEKTRELEYARMTGDLV